MRKRIVNIGMIDMNKRELEDFLNTRLDELKVVEVTDGEITIEYLSWPKPKLLTLYLNHKLNEEQGLPKSFNKVK